jgi:hypothetical protein
MKFTTIVCFPIMMAQCVRSFRVQVGRTKISIQQFPGVSHSHRSLCRLYATDEDRKRVVFLGTPEVAADSLRRLYEESKKDGCPFEIVSVITQPPKRRKRKGKLEPSSVGLVAEEIGIPVLCPESVSRYTT